MSCLKYNLDGAGDLVDVHVAVGGANEEGFTVSRPGDRHGPWELLAGRVEIGTFIERRTLLIIEDGLVLEIPQLDTSVGGGDEPVVLRREAQGVDRCAGIEGVEMLAFGNIPEHDGAVLTTRGAEGTVRRDGNGVDRGVVTDELGAELHSRNVPNHNSLVPTARDEKWGLGGWREAHTGNPIGVLIFGKGVLALTKSVPQLDGLVTGGRNDLTIVLRESDGEDILLVAVEDTNGVASVEIPQTEGLVPRTGEGELAIRGDHNIRDGAIVAGEGLAGVTVGFLIRGKFPNHDGLVTRTGDETLLVSMGSGDGGDPTAVTRHVRVML